MNTKLNFNEWHSQILESIDAAPAAPVKTESTNTTTQAPSAPAVDTAIDASPSKTEIIQDVDTIMNSLQKLSVQIKEAVDALEVFEGEELNEDELNEDYAIFELEAGEVAGKLADWMFYAPKYRKMQQKVNKMQMNALDIQIAIDNLSDEEGIDPKTKKAKRDMLKAKKETMDNQVDDLQKAIDDKARERGQYIQKVLSTEKIKGKMALVKRSSGQEDDPEKQKDLATSMKELNKRLQDEQNAIKALRDEEKQNESSKKNKAAAEADANAKKRKDQEEENKAKEETKEEPKQEEPKKEEPKNKASELEADIKSYNNNIAEERDAIEKAKEELKTEKDPEKVAKLKDSIQKSKEDIQEMQGEIKKLKDDFKKSAPAKESLIFAANELGLNEMSKEIAEKQDWQFENNSALYIKYNTEIEKHSALKKINESTATSIADKFRMLLG